MTTAPFLLVLVLVVVTAAGDNRDLLKREDNSHSEGSPEAISAWRKFLQADPSSLEGHVMLGWSLVTKGRPQEKEEGYHLLEAAFDSSKVSPTIDYSFEQTYIIAATIGRYKAQHQNYGPAKKFTELALKLSKRHAKVGGATYTNDREDVCILMQLASLLDYFPNSTQAADMAVSEQMSYFDRLLSAERTSPMMWPVNDAAVSTMPGAANDPFYHCAVSMFPLSFYHRADVALLSSRYYEMIRRGWPQLNTTADFVRDYHRQTQHSCVRRKLRLAVVAGVLYEGHSVSESFRGILTKLDRSIFEVFYIYLNERNFPQVAEWTKTHKEDRVYIWKKGPEDVKNGAWPSKWGKMIEKWEIDMIFYLDLTMSSHARRLGMQKLAPVQLTSHGHPITSGHDPSVIQYFISWAASELPEARSHYTEELKLVPSDVMFEYHEPRILPGEVSRMDGQPYGHLKRSDFDLPPSARIYLSMQKPFKFQPEFDEMVCGIMMKDPDGWVVLHREANPASRAVLEDRLDRAGCSLNRILFLDEQPHHRLLALYKEATIVLDSYPACGDTTTREVLEMGKSIVTLPSRLLGGRWTLGYLRNIGLEEDTQDAMIASTPQEYIDLAVKLATDSKLRASVERDIRFCRPNLFHRFEAVTAWQDILLEISPYQQCPEDSKEEL